MVRKTPSACSQLVRRLRDKGWVEQVRNAANNRQVMLRLTPAVSEAPEWESKIDLIRRTVAAGATADELELFFHQARRAGLDPLARQIYYVKRQGKGVIQVGAGTLGIGIGDQHPGAVEIGLAQLQPGQRATGQRRVERGARLGDLLGGEPGIAGLGPEIHRAAVARARGILGSLSR